MKKTLLILSVIALPAIFLAATVTAAPLPVRATGTANDVSACNTTASTTEAVSIDYTGTKTSIYGIQAYAGISGPAWIVGDVADVLEEGAGSHSLGSNNSDGRSGLVLTFKINATTAGSAYLGIYGKFNAYSGTTLTVNGTASGSYNLKDVGLEWAATTPSFVPVTLTSGVNTVTLTLQDSYTGWFGSFFVAPTNGLVSKNGYNDDIYRDRTIPTTSPVEIDYTGKSTKVYGIQSYAGLSGPAWVVSGVASVLEDGSSSHNIGSNTGDGRSAFAMSFAVNSTVAGQAYLNIYAELHDNASTTTGATLNVNGTSSSINFYALNTTLNNSAVPTRIGVTLVQGVNNISVTMQSNYEIWVGSWSVTPLVLSYDKITISNWENKTGDMSADAAAFGLNAYDNSADYGKTGSVEYHFTCTEARDYTLTVKAMAGAQYANRAKITVNGTVFQEGGKDYVSFSTAAGWSGDSTNTYTLSLVAGTNIIKFENSLACLASDKSAEVASGTSGSILVSNWWVHGVSITKILTDEEQAVSYAQAFNTILSLTCDNTAPQAITAANWQSLNDQYTAISSGAKSRLKAVVVSSETDADIKQAISRYDYVMNKSAYSSFADFIGRYPSRVQGTEDLGRSFSDKGALPLTIGISALALGAVAAGFILLKKRNH